MRDYKDALQVWASQKFLIDYDSISDVALNHTKGPQGCDTCDMGGECEFEVIVQYETSKNSHKIQTFEFDVDELTTIVAEIVEAGKN